MARSTEAINVAVGYGLNQERLPQRVPSAERPKAIVKEKWDRIVENAERFLRKQGHIRP